MNCYSLEDFSIHLPQQAGQWRLVIKQQNLGEDQAVTADFVVRPVSYGGEYGLYTKILAFAGSTRKESFNKKLVKIAAEAARCRRPSNLARPKGYSYPPLRWGPGSRTGDTGKWKKLKALLLAHDGFLISAPQYNSGISGVLKNAIDWPRALLPGKDLWFVLRARW